MFRPYGVAQGAISHISFHDSSLLLSVCQYTGRLYIYVYYLLFVIICFSLYVNSFYMLSLVVPFLLLFMLFLVICWYLLLLIVI